MVPFIWNVQSGQIHGDRNQMNVAGSAGQKEELITANGYGIWFEDNCVLKIVVMLAQPANTLKLLDLYTLNGWIVL